MSVTSLLLYAFLALLSYILYRLKKRLGYWQQLGIACIKPTLVFGNIVGLQTKRSFADIWLYHYKKFKGTGPFSGFYWFHSPAVFILDTTLIKNILITHFSKFTDRGMYSNTADDPLSGQLFFLDGHQWRTMRNKLSPIFTSGKMKFMFSIMMSVGQEFVQVFAEMLTNNDTVEVKELLARFTTDVIGSCAFGIECNSLRDPEAEFRIMGKKALIDRRHGLMGIALMNSFPDIARKLHVKQTPQHIEDFFLRIVRETLEYREQHQIRRNDFMDILMELKNNKQMKTEDGEAVTNLTLEEVAVQAFLFFTGGFETSSTTMCFALYELAQHTEIQQRAREEVQQVFEQHKDITYESLKEMQYLDQVISETLRLYTVLPIINRYCLEDYAVPGHPKYVIKKGMQVLIPINAIHCDAEFYANPNVFNPNNFSPELVMSRDAMTFLPFGGGPRNCIGMRFGLMQTRVGLALLLKHFKFAVCPATQIPMEYDRKSFLLTPKDNIFLKVEAV